MKLVIQRVKEASVAIAGEQTAAIGRGLLVFVGIETGDGKEDMEWLAHKLLNIRLFNDQQGVMNESVLDCKGELLVVSQFTLLASTKKGNRPSYIQAAVPEIAIPIYTAFLAWLETGLGKPIQSGTFGADMQLALLNDGPVTILIDSRNRV
jgi:D-tyrosyl-tRNA(Tyr) deacylase